MPSLSNQVVTNGKIPFFFYGSIVFHCIYCIYDIFFSIPLLVDTGYFHVLVTINSATVNMEMHIPFLISIFVLLDKHPEVNLLDHGIVLFFNFLKSPYTFPTVA